MNRLLKILGYSVLVFAAAVIVALIGISLFADRHKNKPAYEIYPEIPTVNSVCHIRVYEAGDPTDKPSQTIIANDVASVTVYKNNMVVAYFTPESPKKIQKTIVSGDKTVFFVNCSVIGAQVV